MVSKLALVFHIKSPDKENRLFHRLAPWWLVAVIAFLRDQVNQSPIKELDLNVKTQETGNNEKELEIALNQLRRRNRQLEDKLATLYRQLQDKDNEMKKMHAEMSASIESLERSNFEKAKGMRGNNLYSNLAKETKAGFRIL